MLVILFFVSVFAPCADIVNRRFILPEVQKKVEKAEFLMESKMKLELECVSFLLLSSL
jgi:hypothetical protein